MTLNKADSRRKRVLVLTSTFPRWERDTEPAFVHALCERLSERFDIWVLAPHAPGAKTKDCFGSIHVVRFRYFFEWGESLAYQGGIMAKLRSKRLRYFLVPPFMVFQWIAILRLLLSQHFDVVHAHWLFPQGFAVTLAKRVLPRFPALVCTSHGTDLNGLQGGMFTRIKRFAIRHSDAFTVVSEAMQKKAQSLNEGLHKTSIVPMGVDARELFTPSKITQRSARQLLFVGRLDSQKGLDTLLCAMPEVLVKFPDSTLLIVGFGPERESLQSQVTTLELSNSVTFAGAIPNNELVDYYRRAALLVFPSIGAEGLPVVCAEALACECPVVASDFSSVHEIVQNGVSGAVFAAGDARALTREIVGLLSNDTRRVAMGVAGRDYVLAHFDWSKVVADFAAIYDRLIDLAPNGD